MVLRTMTKPLALGEGWMLQVHGGKLWASYQDSESVEKEEVWSGDGGRGGGRRDPGEGSRAPLCPPGPLHTPWPSLVLTGPGAPRPALPTQSSLSKPHPLTRLHRSFLCTYCVSGTVSEDTRELISP